MPLPVVRPARRPGRRARGRPRGDPSPAGRTAPAPGGRARGDPRASAGHRRGPADARPRASCRPSSPAAGGRPGRGGCAAFRRWPARFGSAGDAAAGVGLVGVVAGHDRGHVVGRSGLVAGADRVPPRAAPLPASHSSASIASVSETPQAAVARASNATRRASGVDSSMSPLSSSGVSADAVGSPRIPAAQPRPSGGVLGVERRGVVGGVERGVQSACPVLELGLVAPLQGGQPRRNHAAVGPLGPGLPVAGPGRAGSSAAAARSRAAGRRRRGGWRAAAGRRRPRRSLARHVLDGPLLAAPPGPLLRVPDPGPQVAADDVQGVVELGQRRGRVVHVEPGCGSARASRSWRPGRGRRRTTSLNRMVSSSACGGSG